jgi:hypothetical protein
MLFVDGENFTKQGQDVLKDADIRPDVIAWLRDVYLWFPGYSATSPFISPSRMYFPSRDPGPPPPSAPSATRAHFYTSMPFENEHAVTSARLSLRALGFEPRMFQRRKGRTKAVDLALATDALTLAGEGRYEVAVLFAGDGDYVPVVEALKRLGRHVVVGFFVSHGLSDELRIAADDFVDLTDDLTSRWKNYHDQKAAELAAAKAKAEKEAAEQKVAEEAVPGPDAP